MDNKQYISAPQERGVHFPEMWTWKNLFLIFDEPRPGSETPCSLSNDGNSQSCMTITRSSLSRCRTLRRNKNFCHRCAMQRGYSTTMFCKKIVAHGDGRRKHRALHLVCRPRALREDVAPQVAALLARGRIDEGGDHSGSEAHEQKPKPKQP